MFNETEADEKAYLKSVVNKLNLASRDVYEQMVEQSDSVYQTSKEKFDSIAEMDDVEIASYNISIEQYNKFGKNASTIFNHIQQLIQSPYFGRVDFSYDNGPIIPYSGRIDFANVYIGLHSFDYDGEQLIYDWRTAMAGLFYDFEIGDAYYIAPDGRKYTGSITLKRQYQITNSVMDYMIESSVTINDDVLRKVLSGNSSEKMRNIVSTIQHEQNKIIRNTKDHILLIQGVAGSGKTSIALHRVAFLLYRFKGDITAENVLIISPNQVFASYISNVLPELGEENILSYEMEDLADMLLGRYSKNFRSFTQQVETLLTAGDNSSYAQAIKYKSSKEFFNRLIDYIPKIEESAFSASGFRLEEYGIPIPAKSIQYLYKKYSGLSYKEKIAKMVDYITGRIAYEFDISVTKRLERSIRSKIASMFKKKSPLALYKEFLSSLGLDDNGQKDKKLDYSDVFPFIYVRSLLETIKIPVNIKHLLIDEMQDYSIIQYMTIKRLFDCDMTILGDYNQIVNPYVSTSIEDIQKVFSDSNPTLIELQKSYRSTYEIMKFALKVLPNDKLDIMERHGEEPTVLLCKNENNLLDKIGDLLSQFGKSGYKSLGIICKTASEVTDLYKKLSDSFPDMTVIDSKSQEFVGGVVITTAHMAKGLEFDQVIIPYSDSDHYDSDIDRFALYVACTRAMHKLDLLYCGKISKFLV